MAPSLLQRVENGNILSRAQAEEAMEEILSGRVETSEIASLLRAMNARPIEPQELTGFASVMRRHAAPVFSDERLRPAHLVDTCGTGGDGCETFNISTVAAIIASAAGASVASANNAIPPNFQYRLMTASSVTPRALDAHANCQESKPWAKTASTLLVR